MTHDAMTHHGTDAVAPQRLMPDLIPMSFADMLRDAPVQRARLKLPPWLHFPAVHVRKDQAALTECERERFLCAFQAIVNDGTLGKLVAIHGETHYQHGTQRFLPWHRVYLEVMEDALRAAHPDVTLPYWDWTKEAEQGVPAWLAGFTPTVPMPAPATPMTVVRSPQSSADLATIASNVPSVMAETAFGSFTSGLEGIHGSVHVWIGGNMSMIPTAPSDVLFWLHHANIDRLWWQWQQANPGQHPALSGTGPNSPVMDPWSTTEVQTRNATLMGFTYV
jgi:tyrosinase